jgi:hypothetical protein
MMSGGRGSGMKLIIIDTQEMIDAVTPVAGRMVGAIDDVSLERCTIPDPKTEWARTLLKGVAGSEGENCPGSVWMFFIPEGNNPPVIEHGATKDAAAQAAAIAFAETFTVNHVCSPFDLADFGIALAAAEKREATLREVAQKVELLIHFTQEYCGDEMLPNLEGWSHYDARMMLLEVLAATAAPVTSNDRTCPACGKVLEPLEEVER